MSRIFMSHSSVDWREAVALKHWLGEQRPELADEIFLDIDPRTGLRLGEHWDAQLLTSNSRCRYLICLLSAKWLASTECTVEYRTAEGFGKRILVARLEDTGDGDITARWHRCDLFAAGARTEIAVPGGPPVRFNTAALDQLNKAIEGVGPELPWLDVTAPGAVVVGEIPRQPQAFVERVTVQRLADALEGAGVAVVCALTGLRGVGKTQVAAAYARARVAAGDGLVAWVNAESRDGLLSGLARIAQRVGVADPDGDSLKSAQRLREHLEARRDAALVVFDNAVDPDTLLEFLPAAGSTRVVITSTDRAFSEFGQGVDVAAFSRPESVAYLRQRTDVDDEAGAATVAAQLGDFPVALAQAAATIRGQRLTYQRYLQRLARVPVAEVLGRVAGQGYPHATAAALLLSIQTTESEDPSGITGLLLRVVAVLSPAGVRRDLLDAVNHADMDESAEGAVDAALEGGVRGSLLSWSVGGDSVIMHRLVARVLRERDQAAGRWTPTLAHTLDMLEPHLFDELRAWAQRDLGSELVSHIEALWEVTSVAPPDDPDIMARELRARTWGVQQLAAAADLTRAIDLGLHVAADCERVLGADHPDTLTSRHNLAYAYASAGRLDEAIPLLERTLTDRERILGADHSDTLASRHSLAGAYRSAGRLDEAIPLLERTVADCERILGADHPDTLELRSSLAYAYQSARRLAEAIPLLERTLTDRERILGADHPHTLASRHNLAYVYQEAGRLDEAIALLERTVADGERVLGADHPDTLQLRKNLAYAYQEAGRLDEAIALLERTVTDRQRILGADHPHTLDARHGLANAYAWAGRLDEAIPLFEAAVADCERVLGADHPDTLASRGSLAYAYQSAGRLDEAIALHERTLTDRERILDADHPDTLTSRHNLADAYASAGRLDEAIQLNERTLTDRERILGADHPETLATRHNLANAYQSAGRLDEAIALHERTLTDCQRVLGADHPDTLISRHNLADAYAWAGRLDEAIALHERTLTDRERILGADHPHTLISRGSLADAYQSAGRLDEAIALYERTLTDRERILGADHPDTLTSRHNLADAYRSAGRLDEAIPLHERTLADRERVLGADHPDTLASRNRTRECRAHRR
ncbi:FxSxx-COOH system tetratricopeptide repeat protein [Mycobacterium sp.]|uniref:FxSxx-COOH system tetratricopeptide repeat protein n=1 Tax=Mycobacterium sp. TaxID=1785 RepID=UPI002BAFC6A0|nr:FxSxx-COOH system tetratricopeptide repeat protein [Mycobacterium sp.]HTY33470.1 FxSxx-COOH system tetratricopeptide repeat protein [Mycobacterium sp.]